MTFSILARCAESGLIGMAVSSSSPAVAARCAHARAGVGAVASQNITDPSLGPRGLDLMASGASAQEALQRLIEAPFAEYRQLGLIDRQGRTAVYSGALSLGIHASAQGRNVICAGNLLANEGVPAAMVAAFETCDGHLGARLLQAMKAALFAGGEEGPVHSAGLLLVRDQSWPLADLRVDWCAEDPIERLCGLWQLYRPQMEDYVLRALDPRRAPSYGVPGDQ